MRGAAPRALLAAGAIAVGAAAPARAACTYNSIAAPSGVFALFGDVCAAAPGTYTPTVAPDVLLPVPYTGFGFFASNEDAEGVVHIPGVIDAAGAVTILTNTGDFVYANAYGAWSQGTGTQINFGGATTIATAGAESAGLFANGGAITATAPVTITTTGTASNGVMADGGGKVTLNGGSVTVSGIGSFGLSAGEAGSTIAASNLAVTTEGDADPETGAPSIGVFAWNGGTATFSGGSITTGGAGAAASVAADSGSAVDLGGATILTAGDRAAGLVVTGSGASGTANGVSITTHGADSYGAYNGSSATAYPNGGAVALTNTTILTTGDHAYGVATNSGGQTTVNGGSVATTGAHAIGVLIQDSGTSTSLTGTTVSTAGIGSNGVVLNGTGSSLALSGVTVVTTGGRDPDTGFDSTGVYNGTNGAGTVVGGGVATILNSRIATSGDNAAGVVAADGGSTAVTGGSVGTAGNAAYAVVANSGGLVRLNGTTIATTGDGSGGLSVNGAGSEIDATGVTIVTKGGYDPVSGKHAYGLYNGPYGAFTSGGVASLANSMISTFGEGMHGVVTGAGGTTTLAGTGVSTAGAGAAGVLSYGGGVTSVSGGSIATLGANAFGVAADGAGSRVNLASTAITTAGAGAFGLYANDRAATGVAGTIMATGPLAIQTKSPLSAAVALSGDGATVAATGGGTITAAGNAIAFLGGTGQSATFDNFQIKSSGDLAFADPSVGTLNFNATTANAGADNLLNATGGSAITLNASASMLTGAIQTDALSTTNVNLANGTTWNLTGSSAVTNLSLAHSIIVFAPPGAGAFKTLTLTNYVGNGANIAMNVALGGSGSAGDRIVVSGGSATGSTLLTIANAGGPGGQTSGAGIPVVMATDGGAIAANAFSLANVPMAGGYRYTLAESGGAWYLVSSPTATVAGLTSSIDSIARAQQSQMITNRVLGSLLLGATQQISCSSCGGGFASIGSFALGGSGRWKLSDNLTVLGGLSYNQWSASGITVYDAPTVAGALLYDFVNWGKSRPFLEVGAGLTPYEQVNTSRVYANGLTNGYGYASAIDRQASVFGRAGWVDRLTPIDEAAAYVDLGRSWMQTGGYSEQETAINPFPATVPNGMTALNTARLGAQYTHLFNGNIEANVSAAVAYGFGAGTGAPFNILEFGTLAPGAIGDSAWFEYGARLGYRVTDRLVVDAFVLGTAGGLAGNYVHGGFGVRLAF